MAIGVYTLVDRYAAYFYIRPKSVVKSGLSKRGLGAAFSRKERPSDKTVKGFDLPPFRRLFGPSGYNMDESAQFAAEFTE